MFKENYFKLILYMVVVVLINVAGITLFFRADLTQSKMFSLSPASNEAVATLSEPLTIKVFFSRNLPAPHNNTERYLRDLLEEYAAGAGDRFNYTFYDVSSEDEADSAVAEENKKMAKDYGVSPVQIRQLESDEFKSKLAYMGLVIIHGDLIEKLPAITSTNGLEYQLTTAIQKLNNKVSALMRLDEKVKITLYLSSSLNTIAPFINLNQLPQAPALVDQMIEKINIKSLGQVEYRLVDVKDKAQIEQLSKTHDLMALNWPDIPDKQVKAGQGTAGLVMEYQDKSQSLPLISVLEIPIIGTTYQMADMDALEEVILGTMEKMIGINKNIGYLADHGTHGLMPDRMAMMQGRQGGGLQVFNQLISKRYDIKQVNLTDESVPQGLNCLVIARPTEPFSDYELLQIDQALMNGTNIAFFIDAFNEIMPQQGGAFGMPPRYEPIDTGLEKLLNHYGIKVSNAYALDKSCYVHNKPQSQGGGEQDIFFMPRLKETSINNTPAYMKNIKGLIAMQISPVELIRENLEKHDVTADRLLSTSEEAWLMKDNIHLNPMFIQPPESADDLRAYDLAYMIHGTFTSYFKGKPLPQKESGETDTQDPAAGEPDGDAENNNEAEASKAPETLSEVSSENTFKEQSSPAKIFVLPCANMLQDNLLDPEGRSTNSTFILNVIDHMNNQDSIAAMRSKQQTLNPLADTTSAHRSFIKAFNIAGLPFLVILFGFGVWFRRSAKQKKIKMMFLS
ncbi:MAG: ABC transporter permease [Desulfobacteraceae bacterium]|nr:MAG: ABC transporter permease [Desulfobacteraceae bacterium]